MQGGATNKPEGEYTQEIHRQEPASHNQENREDTVPAIEILRQMDSLREVQKKETTRARKIKEERV